MKKLTQKQKKIVAYTIPSSLITVTIIIVVILVANQNPIPVIEENTEEEKYLISSSLSFANTQGSGTSTITNINTAIVNDEHVYQKFSLNIEVDNKYRISSVTYVYTVFISKIVYTSNTNSEWFTIFYGVYIKRADGTNVITVTGLSFYTYLKFEYQLQYSTIIIHPIQFQHDIISQVVTGEHISLQIDINAFLPIQSSETMP